MPRLLLVEDDLTIQEAYAFAFTKAGYQVDTTRRGEDALGIISAHQPDMILLDILLLNESGFEFLGELRASEYSDTPVIVFSNLDSNYPAGEAEQQGILRYLVKSKLTSAEVVNIVNEELETIRKTKTS